MWKIKESIESATRIILANRNPADEDNSGLYKYWLNKQTNEIFERIENEWVKLEKENVDS